MIFNFFLLVIEKMAFIFYQICQTNRCNVMYPFRFPLFVILCSGVCLLTDVEKQNTGVFL